MFTAVAILSREGSKESKDLGLLVIPGQSEGHSVPERWLAIPVTDLTSLRTGASLSHAVRVKLCGFGTSYLSKLIHAVGSMH